MEIIITILSILVCLSIYALYRVSTRMSYFVSNLEETFYSIESFREHLEMVYGLETYYGDDTLQALLEHGQELSDFLRESQSVFSLDEKEFLEYVEEKASETEKIEE
tara:strand:- start:174 stop:494 length:321 start_codon:yes stop_codon:yes gene_type:complete